MHILFKLYESIALFYFILFYFIKCFDICAVNIARILWPRKGIMNLFREYRSLPSR
jgi:hypothetical protein